MSLERAEKSIPLVSIVIITYQQANFVVEAIESALAQDYGHTEIIIADDSSTDGTQDILKQYQAKFPDRIILILSQINGGITANSNAALTRCTGKYIAWLGGDDIMFKSRISKQIKALEENPHWAFVYSSMVVLDNHTKKEVGMLPTSGFSTKTINASLDLIFGGQNPITAPSVTHRRSCCPNGGFSKFIPCASDWFFWAELCLVGVQSGIGCVGFIPEPLGIYRRHANNVTLKTMPDEFITCAMLEYLYPQYWKHAKQARSRLFYIKAKARTKAPLCEEMVALTMFWAAVRYDPFFLRGWFRLGFLAIRTALQKLAFKTRVTSGSQTKT